MAKQMKVEISTPKGLNGEWLYASLDLPAEEHEIRDALHRARVMSIITPPQVVIIITIPRHTPYRQPPQTTDGGTSTQ